MQKLKENYLLIIVMIVGIIAAIIIANMFTKQVKGADGSLETALANPLAGGSTDDKTTTPPTK